MVKLCWYLSLFPISIIISYMYFTDWGVRPKIERAGMAGGERTVLIEKGIIWPNDITIDYEQRYYIMTVLEKKTWQYHVGHENDARRSNIILFRGP